MSLSGTISEIQRDIGRKSQFEPTQPLLGTLLGVSLFEFAAMFGVRKLDPRAIIRRSLRDPKFSRLGRTSTCDGWTDSQREKHTMTAYTAPAEHCAVKFFDASSYWLQKKCCFNSLTSSGF